MLKSIRTLGLCLVAAFAIAAVTAAGASAAAPPTFKACVKAAKVGKTYVGHFTSKECTTASKVETGGKYELAEVEETPVTFKSKASTLTVAGKAVKCKKDKGAGTIVAREAELLTLTFEGCAVNGNKKEPCTTTGQSAGTIVTKELLGSPRWVNAEETQIGVVLFNFEFEFAEFDCGAGPILLHGAVLGTAANTKKGIAMTFALSGGKQERRAYWEGGEEVANFTPEAPYHLWTEPGQKEATLEGIEEQAPKTIGIFG